MKNLYYEDRILYHKLIKNIGQQEQLILKDILARGLLNYFTDKR
jgi:hypothetical protein